VSLAIGGLAVIEGPAPDHDALMSTFAGRIGASSGSRSGCGCTDSTRAHPNG